MRHFFVSHYFSKRNTNIVQIPEDGDDLAEVHDFVPTNLLSCTIQRREQVADFLQHFLFPNRKRFWRLRPDGSVPLYLIAHTVDKRS